MKANQKFLKHDDEAVSPVIAVILMVAITVVLAATVYVWVSGFGTSSSAPAKSLALTSNGAIASCDTSNVAADCKTYVVASASPGVRWQDFTFTLNGATQAFAADACTTTTTAPNTLNTYNACTGAGASEAVSTVMAAGHEIRFQGAAGTLSGQTLRILDGNSNSIVLTLTIS